MPDDQPYGLINGCLFVWVCVCIVLVCILIKTWFLLSNSNACYSLATIICFHLCKCVLCSVSKVSKCIYVHMLRSGAFFTDKYQLIYIYICMHIWLRLRAYVYSNQNLHISATRLSGLSVYQIYIYNMYL